MRVACDVGGDGPGLPSDEDAAAGVPGFVGEDDASVELALRKNEFGGPKGVRDALGVSVKNQRRLTQSAKNLSPLAGGRHAVGTNQAIWSLSEQPTFVSGLLLQWIRHLAEGGSP